MPLYQVAELDTEVLGAATGPGTGLVSLEKSSSEPVELGRRARQHDGRLLLCALYLYASWD